ncbi:transposase [Nocardia cerradoensis]|nr:transposase [Nocardia cerradoensis]
MKELAGRAAVRVLAALPVRLSRHTAVRVLLAIPLPRRPVPRVISVDDFALRRRNRYCTAVIDAVTHERIDVLADRKSETLEKWLRGHPGVEVVAAHGRCWAAAGPKRQTLTRETTTLERWHAVHDLLNQGVGLLDCARRLGLALNMVKRYARAPEPDQLRRPPYYGLPGRPLSRPSAPPPHRAARCSGPAPVPRDHSARLHRQA